MLQEQTTAMLLGELLFRIAFKAMKSCQIPVDSNRETSFLKTSLVLPIASDHYGKWLSSICPDGLRFSIVRIAGLRASLVCQILGISDLLSFPAYGRSEAVYFLVFHFFFVFSN